MMWMWTMFVRMRRRVWMQQPCWDVPAAAAAGLVLRLPFFL
jgi:hypothetical protein